MNICELTDQWSNSYNEDAIKFLYDRGINAFGSIDAVMLFSASSTNK